MKQEHQDWFSKKGKILVVDDQVFNIDTMKEMMNLLGIDIENDVEEAMNGEQALQKIEEGGGDRENRIYKAGEYEQVQQPYKLILMDCNMPVMDGYTSTVKIRQYINCLQAQQNTQIGKSYVRQPKIIACTAQNIMQYKKKAKESGMDDILEKPISMQKLSQILFATGFVS